MADEEVAKELALIDPRGSSAFVLRVLDIPSEWDEGRRVETAERLVMGGAVLPTGIAFSIADGAAEKVRKYGSQNGNDWVLKRALSLLPFTDDPAKGIQKMREVLSQTKLARYELRDLVVPLGESRCDDAVDLLRDFASSPEAFKEFADTWPAAVAKLGTPAARELLLGFVDPELKGLPEMPLDRIEALVWRIAELAKNDPKTAARLRELCDKDLSAIKRELLAKVMSDVGTGEALISNLNLIDDRSPRAIPQGTWEHIEAAFVQRRRRDGSENIFTLEASASNEVRAKLFDMMLRDERRRKSAFKILGQIEKWRLEYGRPTGEPRHPAFNSGVPWPPGEPPS